MSATLSRATSSAPGGRSQPIALCTTPRDTLWQMMLQASEAAVRHQYAAPWLTDSPR